MVDKSSEKLVASINESAQHISAVTLTFLILCVYIGIAVASTTHQVLFLGTNLNLPLFDVQIPLDQFYFLAPAFLTFLHLHLLLLEYLLACKIRRYVREDNPPEEETDLFFPSLPVGILLPQRHSGTVRFLLRLLLYTVTMFVPAALLISIQVKFIPYHSAAITAWHEALVLFDLAMIWYFFLRTPMPSDENDEEQEPKLSRLRSLPGFGGLLLTLLAIIFTTLIASGPEIGYEYRVGKPSRLAGILTHNLSLAEQTFLVGEPPTGEELSPANVRGVQLVGRDLRGADFTGASLINADFRGADLTGAVFVNADLRGAKFGPRGGAQSRVEILVDESSPEELAKTRARERRRSTRLQGVNFQVADLRNSNFVMADLRGANLERAKLEGADLSLADLRGARLYKAFLNGAKLPHSQLDLVDLRQAEILGADLSAARLVGADLWRATLRAANLQRADLRGAKLVEAKANAADFSEAIVLGADFRRTQLHDAIGLPLEGVDLRGANLGALGDCKEGAEAPQASDLRFVDFQDLEIKEWQAIFKEIEDKVSEELKELRDAALARVGKASNNPEALEKPEKDINFLCRYRYIKKLDAARLYATYKSGALKGLPNPKPSERRYQEEIAYLLVEQACSDFGFAEFLLRDFSEDSVPSRPLLTLAVSREFADRLKLIEQVEEETDDRLRNQMKRQSRRACKSLWLFSESQRAAIKRAAQANPLQTDTMSEPIIWGGS